MFSDIIDWKAIVTPILAAVGVLILVSIPVLFLLQPWADDRKERKKKLREQQEASVRGTICTRGQCRQQHRAPEPIPQWFVDSDGVCEECQIGASAFPHGRPRPGETRKDFQRRIARRKRGEDDVLDAALRAALPGLYKPGFLRRFYRRFIKHPHPTMRPGSPSSSEEQARAVRARIADSQAESVQPTRIEAEAEEQVEEDETTAEEQAKEKGRLGG
jgi:hypothetical protein